MLLSKEVFLTLLKGEVKEDVQNWSSYAAMASRKVIKEGNRRIVCFLTKGDL